MKGRKKESMGERLVFAVPHMHYRTGITYRQWLIGQAMAQEGQWNATTLIKMVDEVISVLDEEDDS